MTRKDLTGQRFGNRLIIKNECLDEDWLKIGKPVPKEKSRFALGKCLNCGAIIPTNRMNLYNQPPKKCVFCSNIGNHYGVQTETNSWVIRNDIAICNILFYGEVISFVINTEDYEMVKERIWRVSKKKNKYYIISGSKKKGTMIYLHQMILGEKKDGLEIDHIDGNSLNNRRENLRFVTHLQNVDNMRATRIDNTIGIRGISFDKRGKKYVVDFNYHGERYYFKTWGTIEEAVYCRLIAEEQFGMSLVKNNPIARDFQIENEDLKKEIETYVISKISRKGR